MDEQSRRMLVGYAAKVGGPAQVDCSGVAHRDLGFCSQCPDRRYGRDRLGASIEVTGWRLLAMAQRGLP